MGRAAMAVMDGGVFAGTRLVELAEKIVGDADDAVATDADRYANRTERR
jgi:hypothetical protein